MFLLVLEGGTAFVLRDSRSEDDWWPAAAKKSSATRFSNDPRARKERAAKRER